MDNYEVGFSIKELFSDISGKLSNIVIKLDAKADKEWVDSLETRVERLERNSAASDAIIVTTDKMKKWGLACVGLLLTFCGLLVAVLSHI